MTLRIRLLIDYYLGSVLHVLLRTPTILLGKLLRRNHDLRKCATVTVIKMLGGGSLVIAYPALLALKNAPSVTRLQLLTTPGIKQFAETLGVFDEIIVIRDKSVTGLALDSLRVLKKLFRCDAIVDLEMHSRLTTVFALLACARNRVGFYTKDSFWRKQLSTHLLFCNISNGVYYFYDQIAQLFGAATVDARDAQRTLRAIIGRKETNSSARVAIAPCCSDLSKERMLKVDEWATILRKRFSGEVVEFQLVGAPRDRETLDELAAAIRNVLPQATTVNLAGQSLIQSLETVVGSRQLLCIDSALVHYARLLGVPTVSFWGPSDPRTLLRPLEGSGDEEHYFKLPCSPCIHLAQQAPCRGNNICMRLAANPEWPGNRNPPWVVADERVIRFERYDFP